VKVGRHRLVPQRAATAQSHPRAAATRPAGSPGLAGFPIIPPTVTTKTSRSAGPRDGRTW
jgi:hypothetical protein